MAIRYIGSKARLADAILDIVGCPNAACSRFVDCFCGTGIVSKTAASRGWSILANDSLLSSALITQASILSAAELDFSYFGSYESAVTHLNAVQPIKGFLWRTYSPASAQFCEFERRYFTESNAMLVDGIRAEIANLESSGTLGAVEASLLVADLIEAANEVANIAGTYGCFLKKWTAQAEGSLCLKCRELMPFTVAHDVRLGDAFALELEPNDVAYLDPPYTKRQYASYYHIPETIAYFDEPDIEGVAGLRPWKQIASPFCYKTKALDAICNCVDGLSARRIFLSYSSQGHVNLQDLLMGLESYGTVKLHELGEIGRYRPNKVAAKGEPSVHEYLIEIDKGGAS